VPNLALHCCLYRDNKEFILFNPQYLTAFVAIVQAGSISGAASQLGCGKSVLSRQLAQLETDLGARLIQRSTRRLALTEIGELVLQEARQIDRALTNIDQLTDQYQQQVRGLLRVSCSMAGRNQMVPLIAEFTRLYPQVRVSLQLEDHLVDLIAEQIDIAIRVSHLPDSSLVARKLADNPRMLVASPAYLERAGTPQTPAQLSEHACLVYTSGGRIFDEWTFSGSPEPFKVKVSGAIQINDGGAMVTAACCGSGILLIPRTVVADELRRGDLVPVLENWPLPPGPPIYAVYPARDWLALKTSAFVGFLQERLGDPIVP
jgi:DNA-binding transcriptional LysR family regulator